MFMAWIMGNPAIAGVLFVLGVLILVAAFISAVAGIIGWCLHKRRPHEAPDWLWYGEVDGKPVVSFGRWPKNGAKWRYKYDDE